MNKIGYIEKFTSLKNRLLLALLIFVSSNSFAQTSSNLIQNASLENGLTGWQVTDSVTLNNNAYTGSQSAKVFSHDSMISQTIQIEPFTDYVYEGYVKVSGKLGINLNGKKQEKKIYEADEWTKAKIEFNSQSASSVEVYATYFRTASEYDSFMLAPKHAMVQSLNTLLTQCPGIGEIPIKTAFDNGSNDGNAPTNVIDGNLSNRWSSKGAGKTITLDLGRTAEVNELEILWYKGNERISLFSVETSLDANSWTSVLPEASSSLKKGFETQDIMNLMHPEARYVRIIGGGNSKSEWNSIAELRVNGCVN